MYFCTANTICRPVSAVTVTSCDYVSGSCEEVRYQFTNVTSISKIIISKITLFFVVKDRV